MVVFGWTNAGLVDVKTFSSPQTKTKNECISVEINNTGKSYRNNVFKKKPNDNLFTYFIRQINVAYLLRVSVQFEELKWIPKPKWTKKVKRIWWQQKYDIQTTNLLAMPYKNKINGWRTQCACVCFVFGLEKVFAIQWQNWFWLFFVALNCTITILVELSFCVWGFSENKKSFKFLHKIAIINSFVPPDNSILNTSHIFPRI